MFLALETGPVGSSGIAAKKPANSMTFQTHMDVLPQEQRALWPELKTIGDEFVLYGGTAIALRLGHRSSVDFDFFTGTDLDVDLLFTELSFLQRSEILQQEQNTLTVSVHGDSPVKVSFFGGLAFGRVGTPDLTDDNCVNVASMIDLFGTKLKVLLQRIETKDYFDIEAILRSGTSLEEGLGAAQALYGNQFPPMDCAKVLTYFEEGDARGLPDATKKYLAGVVARWDGTTSERPLCSRYLF